MRLAVCFYYCWTKWEKKRMSSKIWIPNSSATKMTWKILWEPWRWCLYSVVTGLGLLEIKCKISSCCWLNYNASWTASIGGCLLLSVCVNWEGMGILKVGMGCRRGTWWSWKHWAYKFWCLLASESNFPIPPSGSGLSVTSEGIISALPEENIYNVLPWGSWHLGSSYSHQKPLTPHLLFLAFRHTTRLKLQ